ncbi:MAG TPA: zinc dependent phospholipase C family protein [Pyrinomonadaceae bacterium]|nr:zinc dependent phospholipase C family protein [Pyrinomonadaceae bacterium]
MPRFGIHYIILKKLQEKLGADDDAGSQELVRILRENQFAANIGCIGPDLMFWTPDYALVENLRGPVAAYDAIMRRYDELRAPIDAIERMIDRGIQDVMDELKQLPPPIGPTITNISTVIEAIAAIEEMFNALLDGFKEEMMQALFVRTLGLDSAEGFEKITQARSLYQGLFQSCCQSGREEMDWLWFEMLHYRKTGDFAKALIRNAEDSGDEEQMAYAYAWVTHCAADLVGHPLVNTISGSPFRMNVQRHVVIESFMDQWKWIDEFEEIVEEADEFESPNIRNELLSELGFDDVGQLPLSIATLIADTMKEVYGYENADEVHPLRYVNPRDLPEAVGVNPLRDGFLSPEDIQTAYVFLRKMLKFMGGQKHRPQPKEPFPGADTYLADLISADTLGIPPAPSFPQAFLPQSVNELFEGLDVWWQAIEAYLDWAFDAAAATWNAIADGLRAFVADPMGETLRLIQALAYRLARGLYDIYRAIHQVMALAGLAYPEPDDVALTEPVAQALITPRHVCYKKFPILRTPGQPHLDTNSYVSFLSHDNHQAFFADKDVEQPWTVASHYGEDTTPDAFIDGEPLDVKLLTAYSRAKTPEETRKLHRKNKKHFGNAVDLTKFILENRDDDELQDVVFCNWNLDSDRGYGYKTWDGVPFTVVPGEIDGAIDGNEDFSEVLAQNCSVWTEVRENDDGNSKYESEVYVNAKTFRQTLLSPLNISEHYIPAMFRRPELMAAVPIDRWISLVPWRFRVTTESGYNNFFFCNGLTTTPSSGIRSTIKLQKVLNGGFGDNAEYKFNIKLIHNYTSSDLGDFHQVGDLLEAVAGDYLSTILNEAAISDGGALPEVKNPTQVAIIALLHHGMNQDIPLILSGHSQGCMITANAIMVFSSLGQRYRDYLVDRVRFFQMEPELLIRTRRLLRTLLKQSLVYIMNNSDPLGTDMLLEAGAGEEPGMPWQPAGLALDGDGMRAVREALADPDPLNIEFYTGLERIVSGAFDDLTAIIGYVRHLDMNNLLRAHFMPAQLTVIESDIRDNNFRTDPGTLDPGDRMSQLSTSDSLNNTSVNVRDFFTAT